MGAAQPAQPRCTCPGCPRHLPVGGMAAGDEGADRRERVAGDAAGPGQIPQRRNHVLVAQDGVHAACDVRQLAEEIAAAVVSKVVEQTLLRVPWLVLDGRVQRQVGGIGQMHAHPAVIAGEGAGPGPEDLSGGHEFVQHGGLVVRNPARQHQRLPRRSGNRHAGQLVDCGDNSIQTAQGRLPAAGAGDADVLPGGEETPVGGGVHRFHLGAQCGQRTTPELPEHFGVAPLAGGGGLLQFLPLFLGDRLDRPSGPAAGASGGVTCGRNSPSTTRPSAASRFSAVPTTATPRPSRAAASIAVNGPCVRAYRETRSPSGSATGSMKASGTPMGSGTPMASRRRAASSTAA